jgi:hypothetical protein
MNGSPSIGAARGRWNNPAIARELILLAVGLAGGVAVSCARQPFHLPGHKVIWWLPPLIAARLRWGRRYGITIGAAGTLLATALLGGRMPGGDLLMPVALAASLLVDLCIDWLRAQRTPFAASVMLISLAGALGNLLCLMSRFPGGGGLDVAQMAASFAIFGMAAGAIGALAGGANSFSRMA